MIDQNMKIRVLEDKKTSLILSLTCQVLTIKIPESNQLWTSKGLKEDEIKNIPTESNVKQKVNGIVSVTSFPSDPKSTKNTGSVIQNTNSTNKDIKVDPRFISLQGGEAPKKGGPVTKDPFSKPINPKREIKIDPKQQEKEDLKGKLFGPKKTETTIITNKPLTNNTLKKPEITANSSIPTKKHDEGDLLGINNDTTKQTQVKPSTTSSDLFDIFGDSQTTQPIVNADKNKNYSTQQSSNKVTDIDDIFSSIGGTQNTTVTKTDTTNNSNGNDLIDFFSKPSSQVITPLQPLVISTDKFESFWETNQNEEHSIDIRPFSSNIKTPKDYCDKVKQIGIHPIEIIEDQAISACKYNNDNILIHCTIEKGVLSFLVKSSNDNNSMFVIDYLKKNIN